MSCENILKRRWIFLTIIGAVLLFSTISSVSALDYSTGQGVYGILAGGVKTGALNLTFQVRSCNNSLCSGESFVGPDGTSSTYFTNSSYNLLNESDNQYFQYRAFFTTEDQNYSQMLFNVSIGYTYLDTTTPLISFENPTPANDSGVSKSFLLNASITEQYIESVIWDWNGVNTTYNPTDNASYFSGSAPNWTFNLTQAGLVVGQAYTYQLFVSDFAGNTNSTEERSIKGNSAPTFVSVDNTPTSLSDLDPHVLINITANISDTDSNFDSAILQYKNSTSDWINVTMNNLTIKGIYTLMNANFTPNSEGNWTYRILANDTQGALTFSDNKTLSVFWDCTWSVSPSVLSEVIGFYEDKPIGNITIINTGDSEYSDNNCSITFTTSYNGFSSAYWSSDTWYSNNRGFQMPNSIIVNASSNRTFQVNASFPSAASPFTENPAVILTASINNSETEAKIATVSSTMIVSPPNPLLYQKITDYPSTYIWLTPNSFSLSSYVRNLGGDGSEKNTAYNVSSNWTLSSDLSSRISQGSVNHFYTNLTNSSEQSNDLTISLTPENILSMPKGTFNVTLYSHGYDNNSQLIVNSGNQTTLNNTIQIQFLCYDVKDGYCVKSCGVGVDPDCVATPTSTVGSGGGGSSGGFAAKTETARTSADLQLIRGKQKELKIPFENKNYNKSLTNLHFEVIGDIAKYVKISPQRISSLAPLEKINLTLTILSPTYINLGTQKLTIIINGKMGANNYQETKTLTLEIHELSGTEAKRLLKESETLMRQFRDANLSYDYLTNLLNQSKTKIKTFDYEAVRDNYKIINEQVSTAIKTQKIINELTRLISVAKQKGINVQDASIELKLTTLSMNRKEFSQAYSRAKEAQMAYALEVKGEMGNLGYYLQNYPKQISLATLFIIFFGFGSLKINKLGRIKRRIKKLKNEELMLGQLIELIQKETFKDKKMSMDEYDVALEQYQKKLSKTIEELIELENKRIHILKFSSKNKELLDEKEQLTKLIKQLQGDYLNAGKIEAKSYELRLKSYEQKLTDIEEALAVLEAKHALRKSWKFWDSLKIPREDRL